jgi:hypothetical protein
MARQENEIKRLATMSASRFRRNPKEGLPGTVKAVLTLMGRTDLYRDVLSECGRRGQIMRRLKRATPVVDVEVTPSPTPTPEPKEFAPLLPGMEILRESKYWH